MEELLKKLNYKGEVRIALINAPDTFSGSLMKFLPGVQVDTEIDPRYPYEYMIVFVSLHKEVKALAPKALHNLVTDGVLWFVYPKKSSKKSLSPDIDRNHGWETLTNGGFGPVRQVSVDDDWSALRFRNVKFIRSFLRRAER